MAIKIFVDSAKLDDMLSRYQQPHISGFTTNPSLMKKAGVTDYQAYAKKVLTAIPDLPISFEVFADEFDEIKRQAEMISQWGENLYVKIPVTNAKGVSTAKLISELSQAGVKLNITAIFTLGQVKTVLDHLSPQTAAIISIFAGRIADSGIDPIPMMCQAVEMAKDLSSSEILWASTREALNIKQAQNCGCDIITVPPAIINTANNYFDKSLETYSLDTVKAFYRDASQAGYQL